MALSNYPILVILLAALAAPLIAQTRIGARVPVVVMEVIVGVLIGPQLLGLVEVDAFLAQMMTVGMAAVLFMAGMEIDFALIRGRPLVLAAGGWVASITLALVAVALLHVIPGVHAPMMVTIALTTTGLGALLPTLRDGGQLATRYGRLLMAAGTVGEVGPVVAVALALSTRYSTWQEFGYLVGFLALVAAAAYVGSGARPPRLLAMLSRTMHASTQVPVRLTLVVVAAFFALSTQLGLEGILGAFAAGMVVGLATRTREAEPFRIKMDAVCFGWLTPFFFIGTGVQFDVLSLTRDLTTILLLPTLLALLLLVRGIPVLLYRNDISKSERLPFALSSSVSSLGLVVVITQIGLRTKVMNPDVAQALLGASLLSMLVYPTLAGMLTSRGSRPAPDPELA